MNLRNMIPGDWRKELKDVINSESFAQLELFLEEEYEANTVFPIQKNIFAAMRLTPFDKVKVVILGQDPYHDTGQAHGLAFSVNPGVKYPPSLRNIFKELQDDLGCVPPDSGYLEDWATQGVLLLNAVLTVRAHTPASHQKYGWEEFTDAVISKLSERTEPIIFVLWGAPARAKSALIDQSRHLIIESTHPSPLSAYRGFLGSRPFSQINQELIRRNQEPIYWIKDVVDLTGQLL
ncbi:MAG: uracil-DNA glycosylase [Victivallaceae bacterium]|nr:uracil-DNA glycosylase [Victivallaceae bacterium]